jgi:hypothetical protein
MYIFSYMYIYELMRNINDFIEGYNYDMFLSQFIESKMNNKSINYSNDVKIPCIVVCNDMYIYIYTNIFSYVYIFTYKYIYEYV